MKSIVSALLILFTLSFLACKHEFPDAAPAAGMNPGNGGNPGGPGTDTGGCDPNIVYFERDVLPILNSNCAYSGCHDPGTAQEGIVLNNYENVMRTARIRPNNPRGSELYEKITEEDEDDVMPPPPKQRLSQQQIDLIAKWINQGAKNVICNANSCDTSQVTYSKQISQVINSFCIGCHSGAAPGGNILLTDYANVKGIAQSGKMLCAVEHAAGCSPMPKNGTKLDACRITMIRKWQEAGFPQ